MKFLSQSLAFLTLLGVFAPHTSHALPYVGFLGGVNRMSVGANSDTVPFVGGLLGVKLGRVFLEIAPTYQIKAFSYDHMMLYTGGIGYTFYIVYFKASLGGAWLKSPGSAENKFTAGAATGLKIPMPGMALRLEGQYMRVFKNFGHNIFGGWLGLEIGF